MCVLINAHINKFSVKVNALNTFTALGSAGSQIHSAITILKHCTKSVHLSLPEIVIQEIQL